LSFGVLKLRGGGGGGGGVGGGGGGGGGGDGSGKKIRRLLADLLVTAGNRVSKLP
jgi:hypothetical protein